MSGTPDLDARRRAALEQVDRSERLVKVVLSSTALFEVACGVAVALLIDWNSRQDLMLLLLTLMFISVILWPKMPPLL